MTNVNGLVKRSTTVLAYVNSGQTNEVVIDFGNDGIRNLSLDIVAVNDVVGADLATGNKVLLKANGHVASLTDDEANVMHAKVEGFSKFYPDKVTTISIMSNIKVTVQWDVE